MKKLSTAFLSFIALIFLNSCGPDNHSSSTASVYDHVLQSGTIRASYAVYPPYCMKDPNTGAMSGLSVEVLEEIGKRLNLKVQWTQEIGWGNIFEDLQTGRSDVFGTGVWENASRFKVGDFSEPIIYNAVKVWGRADETRFNGSDFTDINSPDVKISSLDGEMSDLIAKSDFPLAPRVTLPQSASWTDILLNLTTHKADVTFAEAAAANLYLEKNPGTIKELYNGKPIRVLANAYGIKAGEDRWKTVLNGALEEIRNDGTLDKIIRKYEHHPGDFYRVAKPYDMK